MAALVQTYPQQSSTATMLQTRPSSASGIIQTTAQAPAHPYNQNQSASQTNRNNFHGINGAMGASNHRPQATVAPIAPYAFTSTPSLTTPGQRSPANSRAISAPGAVPTLKNESGSHPRSRYPAAASISTTSSSSSSDLSSLSHRSGTKDDSSINTSRAASGSPRPLSTVITSSGTSSPVKAAPERYRRPSNGRSQSATVGPTITQPPLPQSSTLPNVMQFYSTATQKPAPVAAQPPALQMPSFSNHILDFSSTIRGTADDIQLNRSSSQDQAAKRYRRRSIHTIDAGDFNAPSAGFLQQGSRQSNSASGRIDHQPPPQHPLRSSPIVTVRPASSHGRNGSSDSVHSYRSTPSSRPGSAHKRDGVSMANSAPSSGAAEQSSLKQDLSKLVTVPARASSSDAAKRVAVPSPLSKPMTMSPESSTPASKDSFASAVNAALQQPAKPTYAQVANSGSPAAKHLAALNEKDAKKSKSSRLRRAFSFGSAAELRRASAENSAANNAASAAERSKIRKDKYQDEQDAEQARIAERQEAGGIGSGIYSGQGNFFSGSTDNLSISSTASSASVMIRKMGKGMKKSTRSLVGLFRPKSVIGVPAADKAVPQVSQAQVSMVTVEAEREKVNVNANPHDQVGGGTAYPRLERNSVDAGPSVPERLGSSSTENSAARRSIVGGEKERAEVLAAAKKGILKRTGTESGNSSPVIRPLDQKSPNFQLPQIPNVNESPNSSAPSTPSEEQQAQRPTGSVTLGGEDYFMSALRFRGDSKSVPNTPHGVSKRNATFSPRIQFHDTWPSGEYDRRGEVATCNRLTPMLAAQIKEELNTFKMEMEVHESSKVYTHFF
ncbi:hypothetical protein HYALB_00001508 [Hymenoscyphus albidus]|uniref:Protein BNI4 n=1 Tax=Hymenoscyphus albidus TaxID=595503 RepID=A0A9N9Q289_9HELO|nr:hypothetical protein HYALB_00001508 [Hymenoscyphus albidus]